MVGVSRNTISSIETLQFSPTAKLALIICIALDKKFEDIFYFKYKKPEAQLLGSAIGMKVMEDVPYVIGLDKYMGDELNDAACTYLKDFGACENSFNSAIFICFF